MFEVWLAHNVLHRVTLWFVQTRTKTASSFDQIFPPTFPSIHMFWTSQNMSRFPNINRYTSYLYGTIYFAASFGFFSRISSHPMNHEKAKQATASAVHITKTLSTLLAYALSTPASSLFGTTFLTP